MFSHVDKKNHPVLSKVCLIENELCFFILFSNKTLYRIRIHYYLYEIYTFQCHKQHMCIQNPVKEVR